MSAELVAMATIAFMSDSEVAANSAAPAMEAVIGTKRLAFAGTADSPSNAATAAYFADELEEAPARPGIETPAGTMRTALEARSELPTRADGAAADLRMTVAIHPDPPSRKEVSSNRNPPTADHVESPSIATVPSIVAIITPEKSRTLMHL
jgi:hypothetical protein